MVERKDKYSWFGYIVFEVIYLCAGETIYTSMFEIWQCNSISKQSVDFLLNMNTTQQRFILINSIVLKM